MQRILVAPGDGVGPEVTSAALHVVGALGLDLELVPGVVGKASHLAHGEHITDETVELAKQVDAGARAPRRAPRRPAWRARRSRP